jgi:monoamine oxidase
MPISPASERADVAIVGAGLAGLTAAAALEARGLRVVVLEAADEVGGRTCSLPPGDGVADLGGEWVGPHHGHLIALVGSLGLHLEPTRFVGAPILWRGEAGERLARLPGRDIAVPLMRTQLKLARLARGVNPETPWTAPHALELDRGTYAEWLRSEGIGGGAYTYLTDLVGMLSSTRAEDISLLQVVWWSARAGGAFATLRTTVQWRVAEGAQAICRRLAERLRGELVLGAPVTRVEQDGAVVVETADGERRAAQRAIVTAPVGVTPPIAYEPALSADQSRVESELTMEPAIKVTALLPRGHSVKQRLVLGGSPVGAAWRYGDRVIGFVAPWETAADDGAVIGDLAAGFGLRAEQLLRPYVMRWSHRSHIPGGDLGFRPGQLTTLAPLLGEPHGLVALGGAERSSWPNNMEGAVSSGLRTAARTAASLASASGAAREPSRLGSPSG